MTCQKRGWLQKSLRALLCGDVGAATVEMAIISPFLVLMLAGVVDLTRGFAARAALHSAAARTLEIAQATATLDDYDHLKKEAALAAKVSESSVTMTKWLECSGAKMDWQGSCAANQEIARYLQLRIDKKYRTIIGNGIVGLPDEVPIHVLETLRIQ